MKTILNTKEEEKRELVEILLLLPSYELIEGLIKDYLKDVMEDYKEKIQSIVFIWAAIGYII